MEIPVMALAWGVLLAGILQLLFQIAPLAAIKKIPIPKLDFSNQRTKKISCIDCTCNSCWRHRTN